LHPADMDAMSIRGTLERKRDHLREGLAALTATPRDPMTAVSFGKRIGDGTTEAVERINQTGAAKQIAAMLGEVERAVAKIDEGSYGLCDRCGEKIPGARLEARPWSILCMSCSAGLAGSA
jgi:DnaK suppressor protein